MLVWVFEFIIKQMKLAVKHILGSITILAFSLGCKKVLKDPMDYYPEVKMVNATIQPDGTVLVEGEVIHPGKFKNSNIENVGFCASSTGEPGMLDKQIMANFNGNTFSAVYPVGYFDENASYKIAAWATNDFGYGISEAMSFDSLFLDIDPPCTIADNYYQVGIYSGYYDEVLDYSSYTYRALHGNNRFSIEFPSTPHAGIYRTYPYADSPDKVKCDVDFGGWKAVETGYDVYVEKINATSYRVTICDATFIFSPNQVHYSGSFIIEL